MLDIAVWFLTCCAAVYLVTESGIVMRARTYVASQGMFAFTLLYCRKCMGFWVGAVSGISGAYPLPLRMVSGPDIPRYVVAVGTAWEAGLVFMALMWLLDGSLIPYRSLDEESLIVDAWRKKRGQEPWFG